MAAKILLELKDKDFVTTRSFVSQNRISPVQMHLSGSTLENIKITLQNMGYNPRDIERKMQEIPEDCVTVEQILPFMIREL
jgi:Holliday junction resolvasome RuvABC DNA-binding subunit